MANIFAFIRAAALIVAIVIPATAQQSDTFTTTGPATYLQGSTVTGSVDVTSLGLIAEITWTTGTPSPETIGYMIGRMTRYYRVSRMWEGVLTGTLEYYVFKQSANKQVYTYDKYICSHFDADGDPVNGQKIGSGSIVFP